ncbi:hypothetical protein WICANDRAFT_69322 [Wickerhamomyces anomalus NRRL Y-366-8]|uniref:Transmembrane protein 135 N-terminal domain-containing protein n=1 Tax=Wickerhamomyces anomalus (strain ATCC 58044 / CBS 1984 / NCYC 433 / NRRL Y-366-8) TaxID=683960 RepID=A0A1E3P0E0_WICAA|nr:uncharacterized protein WICANDRAFT_69322 [Wickerhamomyces anomalus NRRL Y-366-8]ODQ58919.1 hypothetical protein WICANDRAFT_69322 [Wickerhamomyces anomalus NRRL Y-366-8]
MPEVNDKVTKSYKSLLFIGQFLLKVGDLESLSDSLPGLLSRVGVHDEDKRIKLIDSFRLIVDDFKKVQASNNGKVELAARTTRNFVRSSLAFFGFLTTVTSIKNLLINLSRKRLDSSISLDSFKNLGLVSASFGALLSGVPLTDAIVSRLLPFLSNTKHLSAFITSLAAFQLYPKDYSRDLLSIYLLVYGGESVQNYLIHQGPLKALKENCKLTDLVTKSWFLIPLTLSELYQTYVEHPLLTPTFVKKVFDSLFNDLNNPNPLWVEKGWPLVVKRVTILADNTLLQGEYIKRIKSLPSSINPINKLNGSANLKLFLRYIPSKFFKLMLFITPFYLLKDIITKKITLQDLKAKWKSYFKSLLQGTSKLSLFAILTTITAQFLTQQKLETRTISKYINPHRLIGFIAGLWGLLYRDSTSNALMSYILRTTLLSTWRKQTLKHKSLNHYNIELLLNALGISILVGFRENGLEDFITPKRFKNITEWISNGGQTTTQA